MSTLPAAGYIENAARTNAENKAAFEAIRDILAESVGGEASAELTIASGSVTPAEGSGGGIFRIDTEGNAASDTLDTIAQTNTRDGQVIVLRAENAARVVTVNSGAGGTGQILLYDGVDFTFASTSAYLFLRRSGTDWVELMRHVPTADLVSLASAESADLLEIWDDSAGTKKRVSALSVGQVVQRIEATPYTLQGSDSTAVPFDGTVPQQTEMGGPYCTVTITPKKTTNRLVIEGHMMIGSSTGNVAAVGLFQDSVGDALAVSTIGFPASGYIEICPVRHEMPAGTTSATTIKLKLGVNTSSVWVNRTTGVATLFGGNLACRLSVTEYAA